MAEISSSAPVVEAASLSRRFGRKTALVDLTLAVPAGGIHAVVGRNGAGKSTLFRILLGFLQPSGGSSRVLGSDSRSLSAAHRGEIAWLDEEHALPPWLDAAALAALEGDLHPRWEAAEFERTVGLFEIDPGQRVGSLSRGQRAGLALALALAKRPRLLILDEPTLGLDVVAHRAILETLLLASERPDCTILLSSHQMDEVERLADNLILLDRGRLGAMQAPDDFRQRFSAWWAEELPRRSIADLRGLLQHRVIEGRHHLVVLDRDDTFAEELRTLGATQVTAGPVSFDLAVNAFLQGGSERRGAEVVR